VRISLDTTSDSFETALSAVYSAYGMSPVAHAAADGSKGKAKTNGDASDVLPGGWNAKKLKKWSSYLTENAQALTLFVAQNAPEVDYDDAAAHLGEVMGLASPVDGKLLGGTMSSGGHALKHVAGVNGQPIDRDHARRRYVIDERVAEALVKALS
jgi:hypothetical protein